MENKQILRNKINLMNKEVNQQRDCRTCSSNPRLFEMPISPLNAFYNASSNFYNFEFECGNCFNEKNQIMQENLISCEISLLKPNEESLNLNQMINLDSSPMRATQCKFELSFNSPLEYSFPELARSYENELTYDFEFTDSPKCKSDNQIHAVKAKSNGDSHVQVVKDRIKQIADLSTGLNTGNLNLSQTFIPNSSASSDPYTSVSEEKLHKLFTCLRKTKGVEEVNITEDILLKTAEFGQRKIAELLNIPFRRYKSILSRAGIKSTAGRKVQSTKFEEELVNWANQFKLDNKILTRKMIMDKAHYFMSTYIENKESKSKTSKLSKGWLDKFVKRHPEIKDYLTSLKGKKGL